MWNSRRKVQMDIVRIT